MTRDGGVKWTDVTPKDMRKFTRVSSIDASQVRRVHRVRRGEPVPARRLQARIYGRRPTAARTGRASTPASRRPSSRAWCARIRRSAGCSSPARSAASGIRPDDGARWQSLRLNLPMVPVHDLTFKDGDVVLATHGRSFYIMDDISSLEQMSDSVVASRAHLFRPRDQYRIAGGGGFGGGGAAARARRAPSRRRTRRSIRRARIRPPASVVQYWLGTAGGSVGLEFLDANGKLVRRYSSRDTAAGCRRKVKASGRARPAAAARVDERAASTPSSGTCAIRTRRASRA